MSIPVIGPEVFRACCSDVVFPMLSLNLGLSFNLERGLNLGRITGLLGGRCAGMAGVGVRLALRVRSR